MRSVRVPPGNFAWSDVAELAASFAVGEGQTDAAVRNVGPPSRLLRSGPVVPAARGVGHRPLIASDVRDGSPKFSTAGLSFVAAAASGVGQSLTSSRRFPVLVLRGPLPPPLPAPGPRWSCFSRASGDRLIPVASNACGVAHRDTAEGSIRSPDDPAWFGPPFGPSVPRGVGHFPDTASPLSVRPCPSATDG